MKTNNDKLEEWEEWGQGWELGFPVYISLYGFDFETFEYIMY